MTVPPSVSLRIIGAACAVFIIHSLPSQSQQAVMGETTDDRKPASIVVSRLADVPFRIDGYVTEQAWHSADVATSFLQKQPNEGTPATERTEVRFCYDDKALYIGAVMHSKRAPIITSMSRRDNTGNAERIIISLDTYGDKRTAYSFGVTASGVRFDYYHAEDHEYNRDYSFDPVWEAEVVVTDSGWSAEFRIPFSQLRFSSSEEQVWGMNMNRFIPSINEDDYWILVPKNDVGWSSRFGTLRGMTGITPAKRIELMPYAASEVTLTSNRHPGNPFDDGMNLIGRAGLDAKIGIGPNLTLDATVNPDFGQVEADPAEVNLSAFETFFSEKRPFFIEGSRLLQGNGPGYFYSRRIGARPSNGVSGDFVDAPMNTTILGAGKVTGRMMSGLSVGALTAVTANEYATSFDTQTQVKTSTRVAPLTGYGVVRLQQEFGRDASTVGLMLTSVQRDLANGDPLDARMNRRAVSGGADWLWRFDDRAYSLSGSAGFSHISGSRSAITLVQTSSAHYFQRPDATYVVLDTSRTSLNGYSFNLSFNKNSGEHWLWGVGGSTESPGFELNDIGRLRSADEVDSWGLIRYRETVPKKLFREYGIEVGGYFSWNYDLIRKGTSFYLNSNAMLHNFWNVSLHTGYEFATLQDKLTRGGPLMMSGEGPYIGAYLSNNFASNTRWNLEVSGWKTNVGGEGFDVEGYLSTRPVDRLELSISPSFGRNIVARQYVTTMNNGHERTYGNRYIFAFIDRSTLAVQLRVSYTFTPDMSLEVYTEPFAASGRYYNYGELSAPQSQAIRLYGTDGTTAVENADGSLLVTDGPDSFILHHRDFNVLSFRSNVVFRWEWLRGSTLYLVWQQNKSSYNSTGRPVKPVDLIDALKASGVNFIALKISYWLPVG